MANVLAPFLCFFFVSGDVSRVSACALHVPQRFWTVMAYCWLIPLVMACLPFTTDNYGDAGAWCSITSKDLKSLQWGTFWRFAIIYVPLWICVFLNAYMCVTVYRAMR